MSDVNPHISDPDILALQVKKFRKELNAGTVSLVLLSIISQAKSPLYGYEIAKLLQQTSGDKQGAIYPVLRNLSSKGLITSDVRQSETGPPRKYFSISELGRRVLEQWTRDWWETQQQVNAILSRSDNNEN